MVRDKINIKISEITSSSDLIKVKYLNRNEFMRVQIPKTIEFLLKFEMFVSIPHP